MPLLLVGFVIDSFLAPLAVARHLATSGAAQTTSRAVIEFVDLAALSLVILGFLVFMFGVALSGASLLRAGLYHPALSAVGVVVGAIVVVGYNVGAFGPFLFSPAFAVLGVITFIWFIVLGVFLFRTTRLPWQLDPDQSAHWTVPTWQTLR